MEERIAELASELRSVLGRLRRRLRDQTDLGDLTWSHVSVLTQLDRDGPATVTALAKAEGMRSQSMSAIIAALELAGMVAGSPDSKDRRQTIVSLTEVGRERMSAVRAARQDWLAGTIRSSLETSEQEELRRAVELLKRVAEGGQ